MPIRQHPNVLFTGAFDNKLASTRIFDYLVSVYDGGEFDEGLRESYTNLILKPSADVQPSAVKALFDDLLSYMADIAGNYDTFFGEADTERGTFGFWKECQMRSGNFITEGCSHAQENPTKAGPDCFSKKSFTERDAVDAGCFDLRTNTTKENQDRRRTIISTIIACGSEEKGCDIRKVADRASGNTSRYLWEDDWELIVSLYLAHKKARELVESRRVRPSYGYAKLLNKKDACHACASLYLDDAGKPKIFSLEEMSKNGDNWGRRKEEWKPTFGPTHLTCRCVIVAVPDGCGFDEDGMMVPL